MNSGHRLEKTSDMASGAGGSHGDGSREGSGGEFRCRMCGANPFPFSFSSPAVCPDCGGELAGDLDLQAPSEPLGTFMADAELGRTGGFADGIEFPLRDDASPSNVEDYYEVFDRLLSYIVSSTSDEQADPSLDAGDFGIPRPAAKSYVESIPRVEITEDFIAADPFCAVCKEEFVIRTEAKKLLCGHIYHPDCIFPWISRHSSCPVCRCRLPTEDPIRRKHIATVSGDLQDDQVARDVREIHRMLMALFPGRNSPPVEDPDSVPELDADFLGIGDILRRIAARHRVVLSGRTPAPAEQGPDGHASSSETVSSAQTRGEGTRAWGIPAEEEGELDVAEARNLLH